MQVYYGTADPDRMSRYLLLSQKNAYSEKAGQTSIAIIQLFQQVGAYDSYDGWREINFLLLVCSLAVGSAQQPPKRLSLLASLDNGG
jgi:hypothetical protein